jgi:hypothetical protein
MRNSRGSILAITVGFALVFTMLGTASIYMSALQNETQTKQILSQKAFWLAEAGVAHASWALSRQIENNLRSAIATGDPTVVNNNMQTYSKSLYPSLGLLLGYSSFSVSGTQAVLNLASTSPIDLGDGMQGSYAVTVTALPNGFTQNLSTNAFTFSYLYSIASTATLLNIGTQKIINLSNGSFSVTVQRENFAKYALFTNHQTMSSGGTVWFTANTNFNGPIHTNDRFSFANNPSGRFTDEVTQHETTARFYNNGSPILLDADRNGNRDVPIFVIPNSFKRSQPVIVIPATTSQQYMEGKVLGSASEPTANGIYLLNDGTSVTGGIFIKGNSTVNMAVNANQNPVYTITQGSTTKTITVNYSSNTTTIDATTYSGIPDGQGQTGGGALIYSKNQITGFSGTVQKDSTVTVASEADVVITNNILYEKDPTLAGNQNYDNLLGIISWNGNVRIGTSAPNNITINGVIMAPNGVFTVDNYDSGSYRGVATLLGGVITDYYGAFGTFSGNTNLTGYGRKFIYDGRMLQGDSPLFFPFMPNFTTVSSGIGIGLTWQEG